MSFLSLTFLLFFAAVFLAWHATPARSRWAVLLVSSYAFCTLASPRVAGALAVATLLTFALGRRLRPPGRWEGSGLALVAVGLLVVGTILAPRLLDGVARGQAAAAGASVGLSFVALKLAAYLLDVRHGRLLPEPHLGRFAAWAGNFLELPAGPIDRAQNLLSQLRTGGAFDPAEAARGARLVLWGVFKKLVVADRLAPLVAEVYDQPSADPGLAVAWATALFAFQLLADFSAYSDIAVGLGRCLGLDLPRNFDRPYAAASVGEFWRRWHVTFSTWLRDYLFLPLSYALARRLPERTSLGLRGDHLTYLGAAFVTMALGGAWHGLGWSYVAWGLCIATFLGASVLTRRLRARWASRAGLSRRPALRRALATVFTFCLVNVAWVFFRAESPAAALVLLGQLATGLAAAAQRLATSGWPGLAAAAEAAWPGPDAQGALLAVLAMEAGEWLRDRPRVVRSFELWPRAPRWALYGLLAVLILATRPEKPLAFVYQGF